MRSTFRPYMMPDAVIYMSRYNDDSVTTLLCSILSSIPKPCRRYTCSFSTVVLPVADFSHDVASSISISWLSRSSCC